MTDSRASAARGRVWRRLRAWWRKSARPLWRDVHWIAIGLAAVAAVGLGYWGFDRHLDATGESHSVGDTLYRSLALFAFEGGAVEPPVPWQLEVARILAPLVAVYAAVSAGAALLSQQLQLLRVRRMRKHVVVCGLGARGLLLAKGFNARGDRVVAIEEDEGTAGIGECREDGIAVLIGDSTDRTMLGKARAGEAKYLIAVGPDDGVNAEIAADLPELVPADRRGVLTAFLHVIDPNLCGLLRQRELTSPIAASYRLEFFSVYEIAARVLVSQYLPPHGEDGADQVPQHMVVVGLGQLGEAVVVHAARAWRATHGASGLPLGLTIVDQAAKRKCESLLERYPQLGTVCELTDPKQTEVNIEDPAFQRAEFLQVEGPRAASVIYVSVDDDALGLYAAQALLPKVRERDVPIVVRMRQHAGLATLLGEKAGAGGRAGGLHAFPLLDRTCTPEVLLDGTRELLARIIHADYARHQRERGETPETKPSVADWEELDEQYRESSRRQADHIGVKLRAVDRGIEPLTDWDAELVELSPAEVEKLAEMEHDRFVAERLREGWKLGQGPSDPESRTNPYLISWGELEDEVKEWDRDTVRGLPRFLAEAGFACTVCRRPRVAEDSDMLPERIRETLARVIHEDYVRHQRERGATPESNRSMVGWDELPETLKRSNRDQARHVGVKLAAVGCIVEPLADRDPEPFSFSAEELELLSRMEHDRWWRDREADGWTFAPEKDVERKTSPYLVPWEELPEEIREYDRDTVRGLPDFLGGAGLRIVRKSEERIGE